LYLRPSREKTNPRYSGSLDMPALYAYGGVTLFATSFQTTSALLAEALVQALTPHLPVLIAQGFSLAYSPFARCYSGNHFCFLFLLVLRCFNSERSHSRFDPRTVWGISPYSEVLFGNPGIKDFMRLPQAFRCLSRPSSANQPSHPPLAV
jgi:hypothetical protein